LALAYAIRATARSKNRQIRLLERAQSFSPFNSF
jgi:hypothetical protein